MVIGTMCATNLPMVMEMLVVRLLELSAAETERRLIPGAELRPVPQPLARALEASIIATLEVVCVYTQNAVHLALGCPPLACGKGIVGRWFKSSANTTGTWAATTLDSGRRICGESPHALVILVKFPRNC